MKRRENKRGIFRRTHKQVMEKKMIDKELRKQKQSWKIQVMNERHREYGEFVEKYERSFPISYEEKI